MKTIGLIGWKRNENMSNIYVSAVGGDDMFLKPCYENVFRRCAKTLRDKHVNSFCDVWTSICDEACKKLEDDLAMKLHHLAEDLQESIQKVTTKFRGNLGEMMVEMLAENGLVDFIKPGTYRTVDPTKEEFVDAFAECNGMPIGIQIKNYNKYNKVDLEVFLKAAAMSDLWLRRDNIAKDNLEMFISSPCQYIIATSLPENPFLEEMFKGSVVFLGPRWLDSKKIQGSIKTREPAKWKMFEDVADEIKKFENYKE